MKGRPAATLTAIAAATLAWWTLSTLRVAGKELVSSPIEVARAIPGAWSAVGADVLATTGRAGLGLLLGVVSGLLLGGAAAMVARAAPVVEGMLDFARSIPPVVLLPMFLLAFGFDDTARVGTIAAGCTWVMALSVTTAAATPRSPRREMLMLAGAPRLVALGWTQPWESLGVLAVGLRSSASTAMIVAVVTEMVAGADRGIGSRIVSAQIAADTPTLTLSVLAVGLVGYGLNVALRALEGWAQRVGQGG